jgi:hypothetical protein
MGCTYRDKEELSGVFVRFSCATSPINEEAWHWYNDHVGDKEVQWWTLGMKQKQAEWYRQFHLLRQQNLRNLTTTRYTTRFDG